ncbi:RluA family pseudouridine synthase [Campylobacter insulaenigrae]|uniref:RluA family pseudouridine synthase n=1 Tax=Campylobacter insulaenigrae TaxID=260714 RepID=UPI0021534019|nr:RluA family pseudouridine synthase [Campylobacter insulaenigrae]MCR6570247.1 RluA family pseudouridine synthase [Campylobacter insulaenigrae]MCR6575858.1 RluA family pseudouridine synthase [Campylobacter insulaenigrae]
MFNFSSLYEERLDTLLSEILKQSRSQISKIIKDNCVCVNGKNITKNSFKIKLRDEIFITLPKIQKPSQNYALDFNIEILYEDEDILILNKNPNLVVHGATSVKEATLVDWLLSRGYALSNLNGEYRAGLVHRLDKGTSGAIVIAKNNQAHQFLANQLLDKSMGRIYIALCDLALKENKMSNEKAIIRCPNNRLKKITTNDIFHPSAKNAKTDFLNLLHSQNCALIAAKLYTGRTHQIRVHLADFNRYILGDQLYGYKGKIKYNRVMLHAYLIYFVHPKTQELMFIKAPIFDDFSQILEENFNKGEVDEKISLNYLKRCFDF